MDWTDIEAKLVERAEAVCKHLFPNGRREGAEFVVGSLAGEAGQSLKINLNGRAGVWRDFAGDKGGKSLLGLWTQAKGVKFGSAVKEAKEWLGIADDFPQRVKVASTDDPAAASAWQAVSETWGKCQPLTSGNPVHQYLTRTRGLDENVLAAFEVREMTSHGKWVMAFPYFATPGEEPALAPKAPEWIKFELLERVDGKKKEWTTKSPEKSLFGVQLAEHPLFKNCRHVLICEGEKDALAWAGYGCAEWGILPLSVPFGAKWKGQDKGRTSPNREWLDRNWDFLQEFETVFVQMDWDEPGQRAAMDIIEEIGPRRCRLVVMPDVPRLPDGALPEGARKYKDANECLQKGVTRETMKDCLEAAKDFAPDKVAGATGLEKDFVKWVYDRKEEPGIELPFEFPLRLRRRELTLWMGVKGCGKSTLLDFVTVEALAQGERALVASFEMPWEDTHDKMCCQAFGGLHFDRRRLKQCATEAERTAYLAVAREQTIAAHRWLARGLWYYVHVGIAQWRQLMDDMRWARRRLGITFFVVDNFMRLGIYKDDYAQQAECMIAFAGLAMELDAHIVVVIHQQKESGKGKNRNQITGSVANASGAHEIGDNAHNVVEVQRDDVKGKQMCELFEERKVAEQLGNFNEPEFLAKKAALDLKPDGKFILHNQRKGQVQDGSKHLWFDWQSQQYFGCPPGHRDHAPIRFVADVHLASKPDLPDFEAIAKGD